MNQKTNNRLLILFFFLTVISCKSSKELYKESEKKEYPINEVLKVKVATSYILNDKLSFTIQLFNDSENDFLIPIKNLKPQFLFENELIKPKVIVTPNYAYGKIKFARLSEKDRKKIINDLCIPYLDKSKYLILRAKDSMNYKLNLNNYDGLEKNNSYKLKIRFQLTDRIKEYCPKFWSGTTTSKEFLVNIK